ncbi:MAG TPA: polysaccharide biosynthesis/export family protein [Candidatus Polarisedimenticolia bacterium]|nr:polysaccharide biosynthesis/export family protein [Candidatus Polarisedimenticolia bacterium]
MRHLGSVAPVAGLLLGLLMVTPLQAAGEAAPPTASEAGAINDDTYRIGVEDVLAISVWRDADLTRDVPVRPDGRISLPLLQDIDAAGKTPRDLALDIQRRLKEYLSSPSVTVIVKEVNSLKAYLTGEVVRPGPILLRSPVRLLQGISMAGGLTPFGGRTGVIIYRKTGQGEKVIELSYKDLLTGKKPEDNLLLEAGDTVVVR